MCFLLPPARPPARTWPREPVRPMTFMTIASFTGVSCRQRNKTTEHLGTLVRIFCQLQPRGGGRSNACQPQPLPSAAAGAARRCSWPLPRNVPSAASVIEPVVLPAAAIEGPERQQVASLAGGLAWRCRLDGCRLAVPHSDHTQLAATGRCKQPRSPSLSPAFAPWLRRAQTLGTWSACNERGRCRAA